MKKIIAICLTVMSLASCYDDYVTDYDYDGVYVAYQYDLRTFVIGESMSFDFTVGLAGVMENTRNRAVTVLMDESLVNGNLSWFSEDPDMAPFTACQAMTASQPPLGMRSQDYVKNEVSALNISALEPLPEDYYVKPDMAGMVIKKGRHTASVTINAIPQTITADSRAFRPYYALGFRIVSADADMVPLEKSFAVIAVKCENRFFGNWYHGGVSEIVDDVTGLTVRTDSYQMTFPQAEDDICVLRTLDANSLTASKMGAVKTPINLTFDGSRVTVSSETKTISPVEGLESRFNDAKLLQDRKIYLNYKYSNGDGTSTVVRDTLAFRNRVRDGISEWQDEDPENYK